MSHNPFAYQLIDKRERERETETERERERERERLLLDSLFFVCMSMCTCTVYRLVLRV